MAYRTPSHGVVLMVHRFPVRRIPAPASPYFRRIRISSPNSAAADELPRRFSAGAFYDGDVMIIDGLPVFHRMRIGRPNSAAADELPHRFSAGAFYDGDVMIIDGLPVFHRMRISRPNSAAADELPHRFSANAFYDGDIMVIDGHGLPLPTEETAAPQTAVDGLSKEAISRFMKTEAAADSELCAVCQENYQTNQRVGILRCRHRFHADCIGKWLQIKNVCPLCNAVGLSNSSSSS